MPSMPSMPSNPVLPIPLHIEACLLPAAVSEDRVAVATNIGRWLNANFVTLMIQQTITSADGCEALPDGVEQLFVSEAAGSTADIVSLNKVELQVHVYKLYGQPIISTENADGNVGGVANDACRIIQLPSESLDELWDSLIFEPGLKEKLLRFVSTLAFFADRQVNFNAISSNRLLLLHGPPGSGKTSLARALAHKLSIRLSSRYPRCQFFEINSHNLFSKYFSESATLVGRMFDRILELLSDPSLFIVVLMDEVETLIPSRQRAVNGGEPIDGLRVVNAILTALDKLRSKHNVMVLTTSNLMSSMDPAFLDRADLKQFVDTPTTPACYSIFCNGLNELIRTGIITQGELLPCSAEASLNLFRLADAPASRLWRCASRCIGLSGRELGKMAVMMFANHIQRRNCTLEEALDALEKCINEKLEERWQTDSESKRSLSLVGGGEGTYGERQ